MRQYFKMTRNSIWFGQNGWSFWWWLFCYIFATTSFRRIFSWCPTIMFKNGLQYFKSVANIRRQHRFKSLCIMRFMQITYHINHYFLYKSFSHVVLFTKSLIFAFWKFDIFCEKNGEIFRNLNKTFRDCSISVSIVCSLLIMILFLGVLVNSNESLWIFLV